MAKLTADFYTREDVLLIAQELLGKVLVTNIDHQTTSGVIVETEAYMAPEDKASHAYGNRRTTRTETFYTVGGTSYVYLCYGIHHLFNIITNTALTPHAVLIRAIEPMAGIDIMLERRKKTKTDVRLTAGPGVLATALGITKAHNSLSLLGSTIWVEDAGHTVTSHMIASGPRIGVNYAEEYALKPWRYWLHGNPWVSKLK